MGIALLCLASVWHVSAVRIPLDIDSRTSPFLQSTTSSAQSTVPKIVTAPFTWSHMYLGKLLHQSSVIELGPRGALFVIKMGSEMGGYRHEPASTTACMASARALCVTEEGEVLPSAMQMDGTSTPSPLSISPGSDGIQDPVLRVLASLQDACKLDGNGGGRMYVQEEGLTNYTVTACDVMQGTHVLVYEPRARQLSVRAQTFGPTAYLIILISATMHIAMLAAPVTTWVFPCNCGLSILSTMVLYFKGDVQFHTVEDEAFFWATAVCALGALAISREEAYLGALSMMAAALYRTHETPYAPVLGYVLGYKAWTQMLTFAAHQQKKQRVVFLMGMLCYTSLFCEIAVKPLFLQGGLWPLQLMFHTFMTYSLAKYRELSSWLPSALASTHG